MIRPAHLLLPWLALACSSTLAPVRMGPTVANVEQAEGHLERYRETYTQNTLAIHVCENASEERCRSDSRCVYDWVDTGLAEEPVCMPPLEVIHASRQERKRRACDASAGAVWEVYESHPDKSYGSCRCPRPGIAAFAREERFFLSEEEGACISQETACEVRDGRFLTPEPLQQPQHPFMHTPAPHREACEALSGQVDLATGIFVYAEWMDGACVRALFQGFVRPYVQRGPNDPSTGPPEFDTHLCER